MVALLALLLCISGVHSFFDNEIQAIKESGPHINPKKFLSIRVPVDIDDDTRRSTVTNISSTLSKAALKGGDSGNLWVSPSVISSDTEWITVSWTNISYTSYYDWIGLFNASAAASAFAAPPIKYQYICPALDNCKSAPASGSLRFKVLNRRTEYIFVYVTESNPFREVKGVTPVISYKSAALFQPMHVHIATPTAPINADCGQSNACMQLMWVQKTFSAPEVRYGLSPDNLTMRQSDLVNISKLSPDDLCDQQYGLPAGTSGYFDTGYMITAYLLDLQPSTQYFYQVGEDAFGFTEIRNFTTPPKYGTMTSRGDIRMILFGDLGNVAIDYSMHHSWDFGNQGEIYSINTTDTMSVYMDGARDFTDAIVHIGDISYAVGFLSEWDDFFHQIESVASHIPWMTGIGNHEYSWTQEWKPPADDVSSDAYGTADGGGECGVPYNFYFPFANSNQMDARTSVYDPRVVQPWYVFDYGTVRNIILSTEHDFGTESAQYAWLQKVLSETDRTLFPWIFVSGHRPMYSNDGWNGDESTSEYLRDSLEEMLVGNKVALGFWGHQHSYGRTCTLYRTQCVSDGEGMVHLIVGMAGYELSKSVQPLNYTRFQNNTVYGFVHVTVHNESVMTGKFVNANTTEIVDEFSVVNPYTVA